MKPLTSLEFLQSVWPTPLLTNETLELRVINRSTQKIHRQFVTSIPEFLSQSKVYVDLEIYFAVSTRYLNGGKKRDCYRVKTAWVDLDGTSLKDAKFPIQPDIVVESGGGIHAYWTMESPMLVKNDRWPKIESINRGLSQRCSGDITTVDVSRILRVPNTLNHKYDPPRQVRAYAL